MTILFADAFTLLAVPKSSKMEISQDAFVFIVVVTSSLIRAVTIISMSNLGLICFAKAKICGLNTILQLSEATALKI